MCLLFHRNNGSLTVQLTEDHKPQAESERMRIVEAGGHLYQNYQIISHPPEEFLDPDKGPIRVLPGRLSVIHIYH
jgi:serine/threonine protein phosphatase PrpC